MAIQNILITGPAINEQAVKLAEANGCSLVYVPPYTNEEDLVRIVADADE